jgi:hypothetical protein
MQYTFAQKQGEDSLSREAQENATKILKICLRSYLAAKRVMIEHRLSATAFKWLLGVIEDRVMTSLVRSCVCFVVCFALSRVDSCVIAIVVGLLSLCFESCSFQIPLCACLINKKNCFLAR